MSWKKKKSKGKAVEVTVNSKEETLKSGFRPRIRLRLSVKGSVLMSADESNGDGEFGEGV